jgi:hypothetical protein
MSMGHMLNDIPRNADVFGENHVPVPLFLPHISRGLVPSSNPDFRNERPVTDRLRTFQLAKQFTVS